MASLPITDFIPRIRYTAIAGQTDFVIPFPFFALTDPAVYKTPVDNQASDYADILIYVTNYTITQNVNLTGTVTLNVPAAAGDIITVVRAMPDQRLNYYLPGGSFTADAVNTDFESQVLMIQQNKMYDQIVAPHYNLTANPLQPTILGGQDIILPVLQADEIWVKDSTNNFITTTTFGGGGTLFTLVTQVAHGFVTGNVVYYDGAQYSLARADTANEAEVVGIVGLVVTVDSFQLITSGLVKTLAGLTPGGVYFLSDTVAGLLTLTQPTIVGYISKPLLIAVSATTGYFFNFRGKIVPSNFPPSQIAQQINQAAHGFVVGDALNHAGGIYEKALADSMVNAEVVGVVSSVTDVDNFQLTTNGLVTTFVGLVADNAYFLSDVTPGLLTTIEPTTPDHVSKPLILSISATEAYVFNFRGKLIPHPGFGWANAPVNAPILAGQGYIPTGAGVIVLTLPVNAPAGSNFRIAGFGPGGWSVAQNVGQIIHFGNLSTTPGAGGSLSSTNRGDSLEAICVVTDSEWVIVSSIGNITVV